MRIRLLLFCILPELALAQTASLESIPTTDLNHAMCVLHLLKQSFQAGGSELVTSQNLGKAESTAIEVFKNYEDNDYHNDRSAGLFLGPAVPFSVGSIYYFWKSVGYRTKITKVFNDFVEQYFSGSGNLEDILHSYMTLSPMLENNFFEQKLLEPNLKIEELNELIETLKKDGNIRLKSKLIEFQDLFRDAREYGRNIQEMKWTILSKGTYDLQIPKQRARAFADFSRHYPRSNMNQFLNNVQKVREFFSGDPEKVYNRANGVAKELDQLMQTKSIRNRMLSIFQTRGGSPVIVEKLEQSNAFSPQSLVDFSADWREAKQICNNNTYIAGFLVFAGIFYIWTEDKPSTHITKTNVAMMNEPQLRQYLAKPEHRSDVESIVAADDTNCCNGESTVMQ